MWLRTVSTLIPMSCAIWRRRAAGGEVAEHLSLACSQVVVARGRLPADVLHLCEAEDALDESVGAVDPDRADLDRRA